MVRTSTHLTEEALSLPPEQRQLLAILLLESLKRNGPSDDELKAMLQSRLDDLRSGKDRGLSFDELWEILAQDLERLPLPPGHEQALAEDQVAYRANPDAGASWVEVKQRIMK